ncbi:hypothetical protein ABIE78_000103 [Sinorhizobium fredii]|nr:hypothetical protein SFHH103_psfHH103d_446 [Sinorhizobium fredii HH103]
MRACRAPFSAVDPERLAPRTSLLIKRENNLLEIVEGRDGHCSTFTVGWAHHWFPAFEQASELAANNVLQHFLGPASVDANSRGVETLKHLFELSVLQIKFLSQQTSQLFDFLVEDCHFVEESIPGRRGLYGLSFICGDSALRNPLGARVLGAFSTSDLRLLLGICACLALRPQPLPSRIRLFGFTSCRGSRLLNVSCEVHFLQGIGVAFQLVRKHRPAINRGIVIRSARSLRWLVERKWRLVFRFAFDHFGISVRRNKILLHACRSSSRRQLSKKFPRCLHNVPTLEIVACERAAGMCLSNAPQPPS